MCPQPGFRVKGVATSHPFPFAVPPPLRGVRRIAPMSGPKALTGNLTLVTTSSGSVVGVVSEDIDLERRTARGVAPGSLKGRRFRDLGSLGGVRGGELGGSESELEEAIAMVPPSARGVIQDVRKPKRRAW